MIDDFIHNTVAALPLPTPPSAGAAAALYELGQPVFDKGFRGVLASSSGSMNNPLTPINNLLTYRYGIECSDVQGERERERDRERERE